MLDANDRQAILNLISRYSDGYDAEDWAVRLHRTGDCVAVVGGTIE